MPKNLLVKYYQENKERLHKKLAKDIKIFLKKKKSNNMAVNITKTSEDEEHKLVEYFVK